MKTTFEKINSGFSLFSGERLSSGYKVKNESGKTIAILLKHPKGGYIQYTFHPEKGWITSTYFSYRPTLKAWKSYYNI